MSFIPPIPIYPDGLDTSRTLYEVFNTSQTPLSYDNDAWSDEIDIVPSDIEIWADNGYANIEGELLYYDQVDKDSDGRIYRFKKCLRGINGFSHFNPAGTIIRGFVVDAHHNQIALSTILTEKFIGYNFDPDQSTIDWRVRNLAAQDRIPDDFACPEVTFVFDIVNSSLSDGITVSYSVSIAGAYDSVLVSFGDGSTSTSLSGTYLYPVSAKIDPSVTVSHGNCKIIQTPMESDAVSAPVEPETAPPFTIPVPLTPAFPSFIFPSVVFPSTDIVPPPFINSCLDLSPITTAISTISFPNISFAFGSIAFPSFINVSGTLSVQVPSFPLISFAPVPPISVDLLVPSVISGTINFDVPSLPEISFGPAPSIPPIEFGPTDLPSEIAFVGIPSEIVFQNTPSIPETISFTGSPDIPDTIDIVYGGGVPTTIPIVYGGGVPTSITVIAPNYWPTISFDNPPMISVNWGMPPSCACTLQVVCPSSVTPMAAAMANRMYSPAIDNVSVEYSVGGLPSVIKILTPEKPVRIEHSLPSEIRVVSPDLKDIRIISPDRPLPNEIRILAPKREDMEFKVELVVPSAISMESIQLIAPKSIPVEFPEELPMFKFDKSSFPDEIRVTGFPESIKIEHNLPTKIEVDWSESARTFSLPPVEVKPIDVKVHLAFERLGNQVDNNLQCFALLPCGK